MTAATLPFQLLLLTVSGWVHQHQQDVIAYLVEENRVLKEQRHPADRRSAPSTGGEG